ncbi:hypothetical protein ACH4SP_23110 [Streptomyces sp. NPDC021093]|uniref:hypothetical protein n=1 Tax=Streptomyces sp. NPDC021093 TaxID=3365112 RepID=UPI0037A53528
MRASMRFVRWEILGHPSSEVTLTARCLDPDCRWELAPTGDHRMGNDTIMRHTACTGHATFARSMQDLAVVVLADRAEQERRVAANKREYVARYAAEDAADDHAHHSS